MTLNDVLKEPRALENTDDWFGWEPGYSFDLPYQIPWDLFNPLKAVGGVDHWSCYVKGAPGGILSVAFPDRETAIAKLDEVATVFYGC